jgi:multidrug transporter EmrE-like cation transporter
MKNFLNLTICIITAGVGQVLLKVGMTRTPVALSSVNLKLLESFLKNGYLITGISLYIISFIFWLYILSNVRLSYAYPFISLSYPLVIILSYLILKEPISNLTIIGIFLICIGVVFIGIS